MDAAIFQILISMEVKFMSVSAGRTSVASETRTLKVGDSAPDFELPSHLGGDKVKLSDYHGKKNVVIAFYPLDWTPV